MGKERAHLDLDDDDIDLTEVIGKRATPQVKPTKRDARRIEDAAKGSGFVSREVKRMGRPRTSPYKAQFGGRCREGMKPLFQKIGEELDCADSVTLELAIQALIEKHEELSKFKDEFEELLNKR